MTATHIQNILVSKNTPDPYYLFHEKEAQYARNLRTFGEIGIVYNHSTKNIKSKLKDRGKVCMFVGYAENHSSDNYRMMDLNTRRVIISRDVI